MHHLNLVSQHGLATGMTAKNLAIVWAPNLLRATPPSTIGATTSAASHSTVHYTSQATRASDQNLQDIAVQATCTEFLIEYCELLFSEKLPMISMNRSFELGIEVGHEGDGCGKEIDIDSAIASRSATSETTAEPQSLDPSALNNNHQNSTKKTSCFSQSTSVSSRRTTSMRSRPKSIAISPAFSLLEQVNPIGTFHF